MVSDLDDIYMNKSEYRSNKQMGEETVCGNNLLKL